MYTAAAAAKCRPRLQKQSSAEFGEKHKLLCAWSNEVCSGGELPEVEIISLLHENIPKYKLRADTLTSFSGYENQDWFIPSPALKVEDIDLKLSPDQIRETLNYFLLCSNRVSQMTKTYNDIEAVTRLLEEKEKDLELTARIGKELLTHNSKLEANVQSLEARLRAAEDEITQLSHDVIKKTELIQVLTNEVDDSSGENGSPTAKGTISMELLRRRIGGLEDENKSLRAEAARLAQDTDAVEEREARLVRDVAAQLASANMEVDGMGDELSRLKEDYQFQKESLDSTLSKLQITEQKLQQLTVEHEQAIALLKVTRENQNSLAAELSDFKDRYEEVLSLLHETQEQLRQQRKKVQPMVRGGLPPHLSHIMPHIATAAGLTQHDSLQSELLQTSLYSDFSLDSGIGDNRVPPFKKVFETVKCATRAQAAGLERSSKGSTAPVCSTGAWLSQHPAQTVISSGLRMSTCSSDSAMDNASVISSFGESDDIYPGEPCLGVPGIPGAADLEAALRRLTPGEIKARRAKLAAGQQFNQYDCDGRSSPISSLPFGLRTPDSIMSTGIVSNGRGASFGGSGTNSWRLPDRLQIVKPMEGSHTLHHWAQLATPTMSGLLEDRPGVQIRGGRGVGDLGLPIYSLNDVEEDDEFPGKQFDNSNLIYTYTNSMVMHPDDGSMAGSIAGSVAGSMRGSVTGSLGGSMWGSAMGSEACSEASSRLPSARHSPCHTPRASLSRRNSTCTFSTNMGLANILNERGIKAVTPSCVATPAAWSPTATPCNSPQLGSPLSTPPSSPPPEYSDSPLHTIPPLQSLINSGADILRRTFSPLPAQSQKSSRPDRKHPSRIVDKVEKIGINSLMGVSSSPLALQAAGSLYLRRGQQSPMTQLTCLKQTLQQGRTLSDVAEHPAETASTDKPLGVPAQPGSGAIKAQIDRAQRRPRPRGDLGTVNSVRPDLGTVNSPNKQSGQTFSTLGTLSSLLFGRKGGLL